jgi:hypothetical protein
MFDMASHEATQVEPPAASIINAIGAHSNSKRNFALATLDEAFDSTPCPFIRM